MPSNPKGLLRLSRHYKRPILKPSVYETCSRRARRAPRWLVLLLFGVVVGAGDLLLLQSSYGPQRLTVMASQRVLDTAQRQRAMRILSVRGA